MSGYKYSKFTIEIIRERKLRLQTKIEDEKTMLKGLQKRLMKELEEAPEGLKESFSLVVSEVEKWIEKVHTITSVMVDPGGDVKYLRGTLSRLDHVMNEGENLYHRLAESFTIGADELERKAMIKLSNLDSYLSAVHDKLEKWHPGGLKQAEIMKNKIVEEIKKKSFAPAEKQIKELREAINDLVAKSDETEMKHRKRLYLLKSLRQVCSEMGFEETCAPKFQDEKDIKKPIEFEVDTIDQGKITFYLALDGIRTYSQIMDGKCLSEFDQISEFLEEEFGVKTKFQLEDERPDDILIAKGELDLPDEGSVMYMERG